MLMLVSFNYYLLEIHVLAYIYFVYTIWRLTSHDSFRYDKLVTHVSLLYFHCMLSLWVSLRALFIIENMSITWGPFRYIISIMNGWFTCPDISVVVGEYMKHMLRFLYWMYMTKHKVACKIVDKAVCTF